MLTIPSLLTTSSPHMTPFRCSRQHRWLSAWMLYTPILNVVKCASPPSTTCPLTRLWSSSNMYCGPFHLPTGSTFRQMMVSQWEAHPGAACDLYAERVEHNALSCYTGILPAFWVRYVDASFSVIHKDHVEPFQKCLNDRDPTGKVQWTFEREKNLSLPFLDCLISRDEHGKLHFNLHRKPSANNRFLPFDSAHCFLHRVAFVRAFFTH